jgi:prepilin-type N-terminal cleavage/methylation domain-containing protein
MKKQNPKNKIQKTKSGFTLIELMVAMSIFMIIMLTAIGSLVMTSNYAKRAKALQTAMDNVSFAMENISRNIRLGSNYYCTQSSAGALSRSSYLIVADCDISSPGTAIIFTPSIIDNTMGTIPPDVGFQLSFADANGKKSVQKVEGSKVTDLTAPQVNVTDLTFTVRGSDLVDYIQPSVYITMKGIVNIGEDQISFAIQTLASQRDAE